MSIDKVKRVLGSLTTCSEWSVQLLKITYSKRNGTAYTGREILFSDKRELASLVDDIEKHYVDEKKGALNAYQGVSNYDGSWVGRVIYKLDKNDALISKEYDLLLDALAKPDAEMDPLEFKARAYVMRGIIETEEEEKPVKLISMKNPVTTLKNKFINLNGAFKEITNDVISLRKTIDVIIVDDTVYMLALAGENLFNMERAYKAVCREKLDDVGSCDIVDDFDSFKKVAAKGHNPRKFLAFNDEFLQQLTTVENRQRIAKKFNIPMIKDRFDSSCPETSDKLIKILCNRGMVDPFGNDPVEVAGSKKWE